MLVGTSKRDWMKVSAPTWGWSAGSEGEEAAPCPARVPGYRFLGIVTELGRPLDPQATPAPVGGRRFFPKGKQNFSKPKRRITFKEREAFLEMSRDLRSSSEMERPQEDPHECFHASDVFPSNWGETLVDSLFIEILVLIWVWLNNRAQEAPKKVTDTERSFHCVGNVLKKNTWTKSRVWDVVGLQRWWIIIYSLWYIGCNI